ncbi:lactase-phlorizin hydrolase [Raphidocelis subcapitata]|uniref:Lactase-phlorizin hydrolase n=1 Tax=Raphidocelis subcapitata TaxID=307507 RepID=A0A2V0PE54_9CHLO|nr:lactase-phlorizin hydrolase [Raphidocelis subcapitata]|eukprot:GBF97799.1 lactase-phlorizin hydrolase [Raphidocelis subcapitata]
MGASLGRTGAAWRQVLLLLCLWLAAAAAARASSLERAPWTPAAYPNPQRDVGACGRRGVSSFLCDPDGVMSYDAANLAEGLIAQVERGEAPYTRAPCGAGLQGFQIAVALMRRLQVDGSQSPGEAAAAFARGLHDAWGVGSGACDNGVVLLLATRDRQVYVSTGRGAEAAGLSPAALSRVMDNMKPALRGERYGEAVLEAVHELGLLLAGSDVPAAGGDGDGDGVGVFAFFASIVAAVWGWGWWSNRKRDQRFKRAQRQLEALKRDQAALRRGQYKTTTCPICLDDFEGEEGGGQGAASGGAAAPSASTALKETAPLLSGGTQASAAAAGNSPSGSGAARAPASPGAPPTPRRGPPLVLACGHSFHAACISEWAAGHTTCPICRRDINEEDDGGARARGAPPPPCSGGAPPAAAAAARRDLWMPELLFRTRRLGLMYPDFISTSMTDQFLQDLESDADLSHAALARFEARHPARERAAELREAGRGGASASFGGGHGGGGAGSSW